MVRRVRNGNPSIETDPDVGARSVLVVAGDGWHRGVIGIVASKLVDAFHRPAIVLSIDGELAHGSCRSIRGFDMLAALRVYKEVGYDGMLMPDHVPSIAGDTRGAQAFAYTFGYIKALLAAAAAE